MLGDVDDPLADARRGNQGLPSLGRTREDSRKTSSRVVLRCSPCFAAIGGFLFVSAADHGNPARTNQFRDPVGPHPFDKRLDLVFAAADFNHDFFGTDVDNLPAEDIY